MTRRNCWEIKECGREQGGHNAKKLGVCPAALTNKYDGINGGKYGGRVCWAVTGNFNSEIQLENAKLLETCIDCNALKQIVRDEKQDFIFLPLHRRGEL